MTKQDVDRGRTSHSALFLYAMLVGTMILGGCSGSVSNVHTATDFSASDLKSGKLAIGGVVLGVRSNLDDAALGDDEELANSFLAQADAWSPLLFGRFLVRRPDLRVWPWPAVTGQVEPRLLESLHHAYARGGILKPDQLKAVAVDLPAIRYLVLARVDGTEVSTDTGAIMDEEPHQVRDDPNARPESMSFSARAKRQVTMAMDIYDLKTGYSVWAAVGEQSKSRLFIASQEKKRSGLQVRETDGESAQISVDGAGASFPELEEVMSKTCEILIAKLPTGR